MSKSKNRRFVIRWREQGCKECIDAIVFAPTEKEALSKLRDRLIIDCGIGAHYLWIMKVVNDMGDSTLYVKRVNELLQELGKEEA